MIPRPDIAKWQMHAPWKEFSQVEQDLVISRTLVDIFSDEFYNCYHHYRVVFYSIVLSLFLS